MGKYQSIDLDTKISQLVNLCEKNYNIDPALYQKYDVKRGLRDINGQGVRAGLTNTTCGSTKYQHRQPPRHCRRGKRAGTGQAVLPGH